MKISLIQIGNTDETYIKEGVGKYIKRLKHYIDFESMVIPDLKSTKNKSLELRKDEEGKLILKQLKDSDFVVLLDEKGKEYTSLLLAKYIQKRMNSGQNLVFVIGGAFGFSKEVYSRANSTIALSQLTFSHQMVRLFFVEQLYRSMTILRGEKYHHQ